MKRTALIVIAIVGTLFAHASFAAVMSVVPSAASDQVTVMLNTQGESINAVEVHLTFNPQEFNVQSVSDGGSIIDFWVEQPIFSNSSGTIDFSGIIPGGIVTASGTVATITIVPAETGISTGFVVASATALLNDGEGTAADLSIMSGPFPIAIAASGTVNTPPVDTRAPDPFIPQVARDPNIFNDQYFLAFSTTDEGSGIDHYEVLEVPHNGGGGSNWHVAQSPYLLTDQTLSSDIYVRAVDRTGNFRVVEIPAEFPGVSSAKRRTDADLFIGLGILIVIGVLSLVWRKRKKRY